MDEIVITLGDAEYRMRPMPARLFMRTLSGEAEAVELMESVNAACIAHPHGEAQLLDAVSVGAAERIMREWVRRSREDPFPPAEGRS